MPYHARPARLAALVVLAAAFAGLRAGPGPGAADASTVVNCDAGGDLQAAIDNAAAGAAISISGSCKGTFVVSKNLKLQGVVAGATLDGLGLNTALIVNQGARVWVKRLTITNGSDGFGGGIDVFRATLYLISSTVTGNEACHGGGIAAGSAIVYVTNSTVTSNQGNCEGGGIYAERSLLIVSNSTISGNTTFANGGGIDLYAATATLINVNVQSNQAVYGGGIYNDASAGIASAFLMGTSVSSNTATSDGGGILNTAGGHVLFSAGATVSVNTPNDCVGC